MERKEIGENTQEILGKIQAGIVGIAAVALMPALGTHIKSLYGHDINKALQDSSLEAAGGLLIISLSVAAGRKIYNVFQSDAKKI